MLLAKGAKQTQRANRSPLHEAARGGFTKAAKLLLDHGADINTWWPVPTAVAAACGQVHMVVFLLEQGADLILEHSGEFALYNAVE